MAPTLNWTSDAYVKRELDGYLVDSYSKDGVEVDRYPVVGEIRDYLNVNFRIDESLTCPVLKIDGKIWMSLSPMEIQSHVLPIRRAKGAVGMGGLGLGYAALAMARKPEVTSVDVWEIDQRVIDYFEDIFEDPKITVHLGDARENLPKYDYDYVYVDIYRTLWSDQALEDAGKFPKEYDIWGEEAIYNRYLEETKADIHIFQPDLLSYLSEFQESQLATLSRTFTDDMYMHEYLLNKDNFILKDEYASSSR